MKNRFMTLGLLMLFIGGCGDIANTLYPTGSLTIDIAWPEGASNKEVKALIVGLSGKGISPSRKTFPPEQQSIPVRDLARGNKEITISAIDVAGAEKYRGQSSVNVGKDSHVTVVVKLVSVGSMVTTDPIATVDPVIPNRPEGRWGPGFMKWGPGGGKWR